MLGQAPSPFRQVTVTCDLLEVVRVPPRGKLLACGLLDPADNCSASVVTVLAASAKDDLAVDELVLYLFEPLGVEQPLQHGVPLR